MSGQLSLISSILAGFSFTLLVSLLKPDQNVKLNNVLFINFIITSMLFIMCTLGWGLINYGLFEKDPEYGEIHALLSKFFIGGILTLIFGLGLLGWVRSKIIGIITSILSIIFFLITFKILGFIIN